VRADKGWFVGKKSPRPIRGRQRGWSNQRTVAFVFLLSSFVFRLSSFVFRLSSFVFRLSSFVFRLPSDAQPKAKLDKARQGEVM